MAFLSLTTLQTPASINAGVCHIKRKKPLKITLKIYTGNSYQTYTASTNKDGVINFNVNGLSVGTHKVLLSSANQYFTAETETSYITITK